MFGVNLNLFPARKSTAPITFGPGSLVEVETLIYGTQIGVIEAITTSPFYPECDQGVMRARVGSLAGDPFFLDYLLVEELIPAEPDFELELQYDPDYNAFLNDVAAAEVYA